MRLYKEFGYYQIKAKKKEKNQDRYLKNKL